MHPETLWYAIAFVLGTVIGSFLNVVIYRLHTGKSINTPSHCLSCGAPLRWYELFPLFSYLFQRGRCRTCGAYVPVRYFAVELIMGSAFLLLWHLFQSDLTLFFLNAVLISILITIAVYDIRHTIIPDELTIIVGGIAVLFLAYYANLPFEWKVGGLLYDVIGGLCASGFFYLLWSVSKGRWLGLGDAKLALPLGVIVGLQSVFSMVVLSFWVGAAVGLTLLGLQKLLKRGKTRLRFLSSPLTIKSEVPFAPFLITGFLLAHLFHADVFDIIHFILPF